MSDSISRSDAIEAKPEYRNEDMLDKEKSTYNKGWNDCNDAWVAIIKALLSAEYSKPLQTTLNGDLVSRADAIDAICKVWCYTTYGMCPHDDGYCKGCDEIEAIDALPSAELVLQTPQTYGKSINPSNAEVVADYISRADAIEELCTMMVDCFDADEEVIDAIRTTMNEISSAEAKGDLISRQDAVNTIKRYKHRLQGKGQTYGFLLEEFEHQIPSVQTDGELISRADAKQQISEWATIITKPTLLDKDATMLVLDTLPSAEAVQGDAISKRFISDAILQKISELNAQGEKAIPIAREFIRFKRFVDGLTPIRTEAVQGWIPCSERLPKKGEVVLITNGKGNVRCGQYRSEYDVRDEMHYWWWKGKTVESVLAWMPLPTPYREDGEE